MTERNEETRSQPDSILTAPPSGTVAAGELVEHLHRYSAYSRRVDHVPAVSDQCSYAEGYRSALADVETLLRAMTEAQ